MNSFNYFLIKLLKQSLIILELTYDDIIAKEFK